MQPWEAIKLVTEIDCLGAFAGTIAVASLGQVVLQPLPQLFGRSQLQDLRRLLSVARACSALHPKADVSQPILDVCFWTKCGHLWRGLGANSQSPQSP